MNVDLNGITAQYLIDCGIADQLGGYEYRPGGPKFTDKEAIRWALNNKFSEIGISMSVEDDMHIWHREMIIYVDSDGFSVDEMRKLLDVQILHEGETYTFKGISSNAEEAQDYGGSYVRKWMELRFGAY